MSSGTEDYEKLTLIGSDGVEMSTLLKANGLICSTFERTYEEISAIVHNLKNLQFRDSDVLLCSPPKSGTHWMFQILNMLLTKKAENPSMNKTAFMLSRTSQEELDKFPSPRVINTHIPVHLLPIEELKRRKTKIFLVLRNPKDVVVSYFHHCRGIKHYQYEKGTFDAFFKMFIEGKMEYNDWFDYVLGFEKAMKEGQLNIHLTYFEDLKEHPAREIKKMAEFMGTEIDDSFCAAITEKCHFERMREDVVLPLEIREAFFRDDFNILRKGEIGQWREEMSNDLKAVMDKLIAERLSGSSLNFRYVPSV